MARNLAFSVVVVGLVAILLFLVKPLLELAGWIAFAFVWGLPLSPVGSLSVWECLYLSLCLALTVAPLVWVGRILIQAYRHAR
jgi:hypothetical protein